jgi:hypothetical protein
MIFMSSFTSVAVPVYLFVVDNIFLLALLPVAARSVLLCSSSAASFVTSMIRLSFLCESNEAPFLRTRGLYSYQKN